MQSEKLNFTLNISQYTSEFKYNWKLAAPVMLGMLGHTFVSFVDNIMVGQIGTAELAAVSLGNSFMFIAMSIGIGFSTAITPLIAEADSSDNLKQARSSYKNGLFLCTALGIVLFLGIYFSKSVMYLMKQPQEVVELAIPYLDLVAFSLIPMIIFQAIKQFSDGMSMTKYPMYATLLSNIINIILNYLLIFGKFGFPEMGIVGAAYGTLVSRIVMVLYLWILLRYNKRSKRIVRDIKFFVLDFLMIKKIINLGSLSAMQMFFEVGMFAGGILLAGMIGTNEQAANQISLNLATMTYMLAVGLGVTATIRVGNQKGLKNFVDLKRITISVLLLMLLIDVVLAIGFFVFKDFLPTLYIQDVEVIKIAATLLIVAGLFQISDGIQVVLLGALRGLQDVKKPMVITFIAFWIVGLPISYFLGIKTDLGALGIWIGMLVSLTLSAIMLYLRFDKLTKKLIKNTK